MATDVLHVTDGRDAGAQIGEAATEKLGFWGATPAVQPSITALVTTITTVTAAAAYMKTLETALVSAGLLAVT